MICYIWTSCLDRMKGQSGVRFYIKCKCVMSYKMAEDYDHMTCGSGIEFGGKIHCRAQSSKLLLDQKICYKTGINMRRTLSTQFHIPDVFGTYIWRRLISFLSRVILQYSTELKDICIYQFKLQWGVIIQKHKTTGLVRSYVYWLKSLASGLRSSVKFNVWQLTPHKHTHNVQVQCSMDNTVHIHSGRKYGAKKKKLSKTQVNENKTPMPQGNPRAGPGLIMLFPTASCTYCNYPVLEDTSVGCKPRMPQ